MAEEVDWEALSGEIGEILEHLDEACGVFCEARWFRACIQINGKVVPVLKQLKREADAHAKAAELAEEAPEEEEEEEEGEVEAGVEAEVEEGEVEGMSEE